MPVAEVVGIVRGSHSDRGDLDRLDNNGADRAVARSGRNRGDGIDDRTRCVVAHFTEDRVLAVEPRRRVGRHEELRAVGAFDGAGDGVATQACVRHGEQVGAVKLKFGVDLVVERVAGATRSLTERVAALNHEAGDDAVKDDTVIEGSITGLAGGGVGPLAGSVGEANEVTYGLGSVVTKKVDDDITVVGVNSCNSSPLGHSSILSRDFDVNRVTALLRGKMEEAFLDGMLPGCEEAPVSLSRKRKKELRNLQSSANKLWETQQVLVGEAAGIAREASRQLGHYSREQVVPTVQHTYNDRVLPAINTAGRASRDFVGNRVIPAAGSVVGTALSVWDAANDTRSRFASGDGLTLPDAKSVAKSADKAAKKATKQLSARFNAAVPEIAPQKKGIGAGGVIALLLGVAAAVGVLYAAWQTLRADDELWVADDPLRAPDGQ